MDPRDVYLNMPASTVNYKLSLDDLDLALLPMSRLLDKYTLGQPRREQSNAQLDRQSVDRVDRNPDCQEADESNGQVARDLHGQTAREINGYVATESDSQVANEPDRQVASESEGPVAKKSDVQMAIESFGRVAGMSKSQVARELNVQLAKETDGQLARQSNSQLVSDGQVAKEPNGQLTQESKKESNGYLTQKSNEQVAKESNGYLTQESNKHESHGQLGGVSDCQLTGKLAGKTDSAVKGVTAGKCECDEGLANDANNTATEEKSTRFCHICNIAVPMNCTKEHNRSKFHNMLLHLANEAVGRVNRHIQQQLSEANDTSYCSSCNLEIQSLEVHEKESQHTLLKKREDLFEKLLYMYTEDCAKFNYRTKQIRTDIESQKHPDYSSATEQTKSAETMKTIDKSSEVAADKPTKPKVPRKLDDKPQANAVENIIDSTTNNTPNTKTDKYGTSLSNAGFSQLPSGSILVPQKHLQHADGAFVGPSKPTQPEHRHDAISTGHYFCSICSVKIPYNISDIFKHNNEVAHRAKLEELKNAKKSNESTNPIVAIPSKPSPNSQETSSIVSSLIKADKDDNSAGFYYCNICSVKVPNTTANIVEHDNGSAHRTKLQQFRDAVKSGNQLNKSQVGSNVAPQTATHQTLSETSVKPHNPMVTQLKGAIPSGHYICKVCNVQVPNHPSNVTAHNKGAAHGAKLLELKVTGKSNDTQNVAQLNSNPGTQKPTEQKDSARSTPREPTLQQQVVGSSLEPKKSAPHLQRNSTSAPIAPTAKSGVGYYCNVCAVKVPNNISNITGHNNGAAHRAKLEQFVVAKTSEQNGQNVIATTSTKTDYVKKGLARVNDYCTVCGVNAGFGNFEQHLASRRHNELFNYGSNITEETVGVNFCETCQLEIPNCRTAIHEHYTGGTHKSNFQKYLERNKIVKRDGNKIECVACSLTMHISFVWGHIRSWQHVEKLKEYDAGTATTKEIDPNFCYICEFKVDSNYMQSHFSGNIHKMRLRKLIHDN